MKTGMVMNGKCRTGKKRNHLATGLSWSSCSSSLFLQTLVLSAARSSLTDERFFLKILHGCSALSDWVVSLGQNSITLENSGGFYSVCCLPQAALPSPSRIVSEKEFAETARGFRNTVCYIETGRLCPTAKPASVLCIVFPVQRLFFRTHLHHQLIKLFQLFVHEHRKTIPVQETVGRRSVCA